jgi:hypothetical protein
MFQVLRAAEQEAIEVADRYDIERLGLGDEFLEELGYAFERIRNAPQFGGRVEHFVGTYDVRRVLLHRFPYLVVYHCVADVASVVAVSHVKRDPLYWLDRLP